MLRTQLLATQSCRWKGHLDRLDVVRGVAILGILLFHCLNSTWGPEASFPYSNGVGKSLLTLPVELLFLALPSFLGFSGGSLFLPQQICIHYSTSHSGSNSRWCDFYETRIPDYLRAYFVVVLIMFALETYGVGRMR
jgi:peptidoglycan/LPS O-acetylase OafA/YrhL